MFLSLLGARLESVATAANGRDNSAVGTESSECDAAFSADVVASAIMDDVAIAVS